MVKMASAAGKVRRNNSSYGRIDFSERREERDDVPEYSHNERSKYHYERDLSSRSNRGTAIGKRGLKEPAIITDVSSTVAPHEWRKDRYEVSSQQLSKASSSRRSKAADVKREGTSNACSRSTIAAQNDIISLGKEFEIGFKCFDRRLKHSTSNTAITNSQFSQHTRESSSANSLLDAITGPTQRLDKSLDFDIKVNNSSTSVLTRGGCYRISSNNLSTTNSNHHSLKKEQSSTSTSKRKQLEYWSGLSVRVAMAVIQANGSEKMAQKASSIVLIEGRKQNGRDKSEMIRALSAKLSVAMLEGGADRKLTLAIMNAVTAYEKNNAAKSAESMSFDGRSTTKTSRNVKEDFIEETRSVASSYDPTIRSHRSKTASITPSNRSKATSITPASSSTRSKLQTIEMQILEKQRAIEEAELQNEEKEREFNERMAALIAATDERLAALDATKGSLLEKEESTQLDKYESTADDIKQEENDNEIASGLQSGIDGFVFSFNEQMTALETAEGLAGLDTTKTYPLEKASFIHSDQIDIVPGDIENSCKDLKEESNDNGTISEFQSGIAGFVSGINTQFKSFEASAKERLADLDAAATTLFENAGILENASSFAVTTTTEQRDVTAEKSRNIHEDFKREDDGNEATSTLQLFGNRLFQSFDCSEGKAQQELPKVINSSFSSGNDEGDLETLWEV